MGKTKKNEKDEIFESDCSDSEVYNIKTNNEYAKNYDNWRKKEELNKLKTKYGDIPTNPNSDDGSESSSSDDDEEAIEITEETEKNFFKTLSCLKNKDPKIYNSDVKFFNEKDKVADAKIKKKKAVPVTIKDFERKMILEEGERLENETERITDQIASSKQLTAFDNDDSDDSDGELFKPREKTEEELNQERSNYKKWLAGQEETTKDVEAASVLKPLKEYWNDPKLSADEKFLKDYILNKRYLSNEDENYIPTYDEIIHDSDDGLSEDEEAINTQEEFEHKFNFRFEEPDQDFIKRYPRTIEQSVRKTDDRRKVKRAETKLRKQKEKEEKMAEIKKLQELKRKEIEEKIEKIREVTGDTGMELQDDDIEGDFDPDAHDRRMQQLFNEEFYEKPEDEQKPEFPDIDEELDIEKWDDWEGDETDVKNITNKNIDVGGPHCDDDNFIMDADYDPTTAKSNAEKTKRNRKGRRKSKVAEALERPKPKYDPNDKNCEKYFDEYYKMDCEDIIGDTPCRFKYREVVPNDFGLSVEEILIAKDRELNKWCSLKKAVQFRPDHVEKYEQHAYSQKAKNVMLKKKILPSLFEEEAKNQGNNDTKRQEENVDHHQQQRQTQPDSIRDKTNTNTKKKNIKQSVSDKQNTSQCISGTKKKEKQQDQRINLPDKINIKTKRKQSESNEQNPSPYIHDTEKKDKNIGQQQEQEQTQLENISNTNTNMEKKNRKRKQLESNQQLAPPDSKKVKNVKNKSIRNVKNNITVIKQKKNNKRKPSKSNQQNASRDSEKDKVDEKEGKNLEKAENIISVIKKKKNKKLQISTRIKNELSNSIDNNSKKLNKKKKKKNNGEINSSHTKPNKIKLEKQLENRKLKKKNNKEKPENIGISDERLAAYGINPKKFKNKLKYGKSQTTN